MKRLACVLSLAATVAMPGVAMAQDLQTQLKPTPGMPPAHAVTPAGPTGPEVTLGGYNRVRLMSQLNYDLDAASVQDNSVFFTDIRSYLTLEAKHEAARFVSSFDLAGTDFEQGAIMGYDNSARQRLFNVQMRHLFVDYTFQALGLTATLGRQPARVGYGIVSSINRDAFKLVQKLPEAAGPKSNLTGVWVRGSKGVTAWPTHLPAPSDIPAPVAGRSGAAIANDPNGAWHELNTFVMQYNAQPVPGSRLQVFGAQQIDLSQSEIYPKKRYVDLNGEIKLGDLTLGGEAVWAGGESPAANGSRTPLNSFALMAMSEYQTGPWSLGLMAGRGGGDNDPGDGVNTSFQSLFVDESHFLYNNLFGNDIWGFNGQDAGIGRGAGLANVTFIRPHLSYRVSPDLQTSLSYTKHLATAPQRAGSGVFGTVATTHTALASNIGDEVDLGASYTWNRTNFYGIVSTFVPGDIFANTGLANAAHKIELGTEFKF